jgi:flagellar basal-body rod protein FlgG
MHVQERIPCIFLGVFLMLKELYTAAMGMVPQQTRLEVTANNIANANTTGFKRESVFERNLIDAQNHFFNAPGSAQQNDPPVGSYTVFDKGGYQQTSNTLDVAIENEKGFFLVETADGTQNLTRAGNFTINNEGDLLTSDGSYVMGTEGKINVKSQFNDSLNDVSDSKSMNIKITPNGEIYANQLYSGTIQIVSVNNLNSLNRISSSNFSPTEDTIAEFAPMEEAQMRQGWLESSNVDVIKEMVEMINLQRQFEIGSKVITTNNETLDTSLRLGRIQA